MERTRRKCVTLNSVALRHAPSTEKKYRRTIIQSNKFFSFSTFSLSTSKEGQEATSMN